MIIGRLDSQIKLRGLRIELREIESVIGSFDGIKEAAVAVKTELSKEYPLSFNQLGVYYEVIKQPEELLYNMPLCCIFENVDAVKLKAALERAVECHSYLNTHIEVRNGKLVQVRNDDAKADIPVSEMTETEFEERKKKFVRPFDLHKDILYRFEIIITDKKTYLLSDLHHIIFDGLSRGLFMDTVSKAYSGENTEVEEICVCK